MSRPRHRFRSEQSFKLINESPTNSSVSKQTHSFSKSPRFPQLKPQCPHVSYNGQEVRSRRNGVGIGIGGKSDFTRDLTCSPGCGKYQLKTKFQYNLSLKKGCSVGRGRNEIKFASYINRQLLKTPPANRYLPSNEAVRPKFPLFSLGSRTKILNKSLTIEALNDNPGPGSYENIEMASKSSTPLSGYVKLSYSPSRSKRFPNYENRIPGPATYEEVASISSTGQQSVSKYPCAMVAKFSIGKRITQFDKAAQKSRETPGAGSYRAPSQFGHYDEELPNQKFNRLVIPSLQPKKQVRTSQR